MNLLGSAVLLAVLVLVALLSYGAGLAAGLREPPPAEACGGVQRMVRLQLSPATEALLERRRGDRWVVFEAREVPRTRPALADARPDGGAAEGSHGR